MKIRSVDMVIDDVKFTVHEAMANDMESIFNGEALTPLVLVDHCVKVNGEKYDKNKHNLPLRVVMELANQCSIINGLADKDEQEKKD